MSQFGLFSPKEKRILHSSPLIYHIVCRFAPEGRDVYSLAVLSLLRSSVGAQPLLPARQSFR